MRDKMRKETYNEMKDRHQKEHNNFTGVFFAFSNKQLGEGMETLGLTLEDTGKILSLGHGGYMLKTQREEYRKLMNTHEKEMEVLLADKKAQTVALAYELNNHEYCITGDATDALDMLDETYDSIDKTVLKDAIVISEARSFSKKGVDI